MVVKISADWGAASARIDRRIFGTFVEHMGRCVYEGIYEPSHPTADEEGFRGDVAELVRELGATVVRYPGGNFVSGYNWEDGIGPKEDRPVRLDAAWHSLETNQVGLHEFFNWSKRVGLEVMEAVNLGTRGIGDAAALLEYCNIEAGTTRAQERRANGAKDPFNIKLWCLGNEMDGPWQIGHKTAHEYGRLAAEAARMMRFIDSSVELVAAGSSNMEMPTFGEWERTVLAHTADLIDHISIHAYYEPKGGDVDSFLASSLNLEAYIREVAKIIDECSPTRRIGISVDEWNVWNQTRWNETDKPRVMTGAWPAHPRLIEDDYTVTDAVVVGSLLITLLRNADRVSMANQAQLVNVIAPIRSEPNGPAWRQTTFFPFQLTSALAHGVAVPTTVHTPTYDTALYGDAPVVDAVVTRDEDRCAVFAVNRDREAAHEVVVELGMAIVSANVQVLTIPENGTQDTINTADDQPVGLEELPCVIDGNTVRFTLPTLSWAAVSATLSKDDM